LIELGALFAFLAAGWFWLDSLRARDVALDGARRACEAEGVQLLDWTVAMKRIRLGRDDEGRRGFQRTYEFEFSDTGNNRIGGSITIVGRQLLSLSLPVIAPASNVIRLH
jgi:hypothetical protein